MGRFGLCASLLTILVVRGMEVARGQDSTATDEFMVVADGYRSNLEAFPVFACKFTVRSCEARSLSDIFTDSDVRRSERIHFATWFVNGKKERFYVTPDDGEPVGKPVNPNEKRSLTYNYTSDGNLILDVGITFPVAVLRRAAGNEFLNDLGTPISYGLPRELYDLGVVRGRCARKDLVVESLGTKKVFGVQTLGFKLFEEEARLSQILYVDPARGCLPVQAEYFIPAGKPKERNAIGMITHAKEVPGKGWFPTRAVLLTNPPPSGPYPFREFRITHFDPTSPVVDDVFSIIIPGDYQVQLQGDNHALLTTAAKRTVRLPDLPRLLGDLQRSAERHVAAGKEKVPSAAPSAWRANAMWLLAAALLIAGLLALRSRRRHLDPANNAHS